ncbi:MAG TPA: hypothetical protein VG055_27015 [Planctomycetaceae bacterium]|jgi:hypothetical protein|nr:hypothetical protein [Planctomycetaceae bacterium]
MVHESIEVHFTSRYRHAVIYLLLLATIGTLRRWGPPVLFALGGFSITHYWHLFGGVSSSEIEAVMQDLGLPAICGACGALVGYGLELWWYCAPAWRRALSENEGWPLVSDARKKGG